MDKQQRNLFIAESVAKKLSAMHGTWRVSGEKVVGLDAAAVIIGDHHEQYGPAHVDLGFVLDVENRPDLVIWSCAAGTGPSLEAQIEGAVASWVATTATCCLELWVQDGRFASHYHTQDAGGLPGWHVIHGSIVTFGRQPAPLRELQEWLLENPLLPQLASELEAGLDRVELNGVKFLLGSSEKGDVSEVRINDTVNEAASAALASLSWPRTRAGASFARSFVLAVHREAADDGRESRPLERRNR